jgi:hypothetical protein
MVALGAMKQLSPNCGVLPKRVSIKAIIKVVSDEL